MTIINCIYLYVTGNLRSLSQDVWWKLYKQPFIFPFLSTDYILFFMKNMKNMITTTSSTSPSEMNAEEHMTLINYLNKVCKDNGDRILAYYHSNKSFHSLTYAQVDLVATNLACKWSSIIKDTRTVSYLADHSIDYLIVLLALLKLRVIPFLISPRNSQAAIVHLMKTTTSKFLLASKKYQSIAMAISSSVKDMRELILSPLQLDVLTMEPYYSNYQDTLNHNFISSDITKTALIMHR